jgi:hypothetical protein
VVGGGVPDDEIEEDADAARPRLGDELDEVVIGAIARRDAHVVRDVVAGVAKGEAKHGLNQIASTPSEAM